MLEETYSELAQVSGLTSVISLGIGFLLGFIVLTKAIKTKQRIIFLFFLCTIFTLSPWYPSGGGYIYWLITGYPLPYETYIIIGTAFIPIAILSWLDVYMTTIAPEKKRMILLIFAVFSIATFWAIWYFNIF